MQRARMHQAQTTGLTGTFHRVFIAFPCNRIIDGTGKHAILPERVKRSGMRTGQQARSAIFRGHIVEKKHHRNAVIIRMGVEGKILVPFHRGDSTRQFTIKLGVVNLTQV